MLTKTNKKLEANTLAERAQQVGFIMMATAAMLMLVEVAEHRLREVIAPQVAHTSQHSEQGNDPMRREREETGPHYTSYGIAQRTPGRARTFA